MRVTGCLVGQVLAFAALFPAGAQATFHLMQIEQVIGGVDGDTSAQAIQLRMRFNDQGKLAVSRLVVRDSSGANPIVLVDFGSSFDDDAAGRRVLVATASFAQYCDPPAVPDAMMTSAIPAAYLAAGTLTFESDDGSLVVWRLSWGGAAYGGPSNGSIENDNDGNFGPAFAGPLPSDGFVALRFTGTAGAQSSSNAADYSLTSDAAVFTNNAGATFTLLACEALSQLGLSPPGCAGSAPAPGMGEAEEEDLGFDQSDDDAEADAPRCGFGTLFGMSFGLLGLALLRARR